jgi:hypothetical protein
MRFDLQQNVMCLRYEHPLLLERPRGWTPKSRHLVVENSQRPQQEGGVLVTTVEPPTEVFAILHANTMWRNLRHAAHQTESQGRHK